MKKTGAFLLLSFLAGFLYAQDGVKPAGENNTLLWKISGNGLANPSYLFGTIHLLCGEDAVLSDSLKQVISRCDEVYLEVNINDIFEMMGAMAQMKMRDDTTLADLLDKEDYQKVKDYFEKSNPTLPFSVLESFKPILAASSLAESSLSCESMAIMEQMIADEAAKNDKKLKGLETMSYQAGILDSIPYRQQAMELVRYIDNLKEGRGEDSELKDLMQAYREQDLEKMAELMMKSEIGVSNYIDFLLYRRNHNWVEKLKTLLPARSLVIAVGAGHLPGEQGVINLLRKEGFSVSPVNNKIKKQKTI